MALTGPAEIPAWNRPARPYDLDDAKGVLELLAHVLGLPAPTYAPLTDDPNLHPGRSARVTAGTAMAGRVGELHPSVVEASDLRGDRVIVAEVAIAGLSAGVPDVPRGATPPRHPAVERDIAVVVGHSVAAGAVVDAIAARGGQLLVSSVLFDIYRGSPLADDEKSLAYRLTFQAPDRTLTEGEIDGAVAGITDGLASAVGGRIRT